MGSLRTIIVRRWRSRFCLGLLAGMLAGPLAATRAEAGDLEQEFVRCAPEIIKTLRDRGVRTVGVLKFRVQKGNEPASDNVGTLNRFLADRLEIALILANDNKVERQLQIVRDASHVAAGIPGANHTTDDGRPKLFTGKYRLAWGNPPQEVEADGFVTGVVRVSPDLARMSVGIFAFDRKGASLDQVGKTFSVPVDAEALNELGESFLVRGAFDAGRIELASVRTEALKTAAKVRASEATHPLQDPQNPVSLEIAYDGRPVRVEFRGGLAVIPEPAAGQSVVLTLKRSPSVKGRVAVVLKVNGENTLYRQRQRDLDCHKWILEPDTAPIVVRGFQKSDNQIEQFRILTADASRKAELDYGADVGLISLVAFREQGQDRPAPTELPSDEAEDLAALLRGVHPEQTPKNLAALKHQIRSTALRGLIAEGPATAGAIRMVKFTADSTPAMSAVIRYYHP